MKMDLANDEPTGDQTRPHGAPKGTGMGTPESAIETINRGFGAVAVAPMLNTTNRRAT